MSHVVYQLKRFGSDNPFYIGLVAQKHMRGRLYAHKKRFGEDIFMAVIKNCEDKNEAHNYESYYIKKVVLSGITLENKFINPDKRSKKVPFSMFIEPSDIELLGGREQLKIIIRNCIENILQNRK